MNKSFNVVSSNPSNEGKTFVTKMHRETVVEDKLFGMKKKSETLYISGTKQIPVGTEIQEADIFPKYHVVERPYDIGGEVIMCKWLHLA